MSTPAQTMKTENTNHPFMKRIIYSCLFSLVLLFSGKIQAQLWTNTISTGACFYNGDVFIGQAGVASPNAAAASYSWSVVAPTPGSIVYSVVPNQPFPGEQITFTITGGCGIYTLTIFAVDASGNQIPPPNQARVLNITMICPPTIVATPPSSICLGSTTNLTITGAPSVTWNPGGSTAVPTIVSPLANTCYTAIGASAQGCTATAMTCVSVQPISLTVTPQSQTVCPGINPTLTALTGNPGYTFQWYQIAPAPTTALGTNSAQTVNPAPAGGTWSVNAFFNTCSVSATASVALGASLSINVIPTAYSVCPIESFTMTAFSAATNYTWSGPGISPPTRFMNPVPAVGPGTYTVVGSNGACTGSTTIVILPTAFSPSIAATSTAVCAGESVTLTTSGGIPGQYYWGYSSPPGTATIPIAPAPISGTSNVIVVTPTANTQYGMITQNSVGCQNSGNPSTVTITINPPLTLTTSISSGTVCAGAQVTITSTGATNYTFTGASGTIYTGTVNTVVTTATMAQTYSVVGSNSIGLCASNESTIAVNMATAGAINLTLSASPVSICPTQTSSLTALASLQNVNFVWTPTVSLITPNGPSVAVTPTFNTTYTVNVDNGGGCTGSGTLNIYVTPTPTVSAFAQATAVCAGYVTTLTAMGAASYTWMGSTFSTPVYQQTVAVSPGPNSLTPASYTVIGAPLSGNCLSQPFVINISLAPNLQILAAQNHFTTCITTNASPNNTVSLSKPVDFTASGATTYNWVPYNPVYMTYPTGPATTVRPPTSTCYTVIGSTDNCSGQTTLCVTVIPQFSMNVVPLSPVLCLGDSVVLSVANVGTLAAGAPEDWAYDWFEAANAPPPSLSFYGTPTVTAYPQNTTTYTVEVHDARACASLPRLTTVTVLPLPITAISVPTINTIPTRTLCYVGDIPGAPDVYLDLTASNSNTSPALPFGITPTYTWDSPHTPESFITSQYIPTVRIVAPKRVPSVVVYTVTSGYNGVKGCKVVDTITVRVIDCRPIIQSNIHFRLDQETDTICTRECVTFEALTDTTAGGPQTYEWTFPGGSPMTSNLRTPTICYNVSNEYDVTLKVSNPYPKFNIPSGSTAIKAFRKYIKVMDNPNVTIVPPGRKASDTTIRFGQSIVLTGTNSVRYEWTSNTGMEPVKGRTLEVEPKNTTTYYLTGYNSSRCFSSDTINVIVIQDCGDMFIPNAFSPNGDGVNDVLRVRGACLETLTFMVFNRWGEKVFETNDITVGWDGTYNGDLMNTGVFVYRLEGKTRSGQGYSAKGNVTLVR